jgi:hypothetical protein
VAVPAARISPIHEPPARLEQVGLRKLAGWLVRILPGCAADLGVNLVVEVLIEQGLGAFGIGGTRGRNKLLQLDAADEVLVLRSHEAIVPCQ